MRKYLVDINWKVVCLSLLLFGFFSISTQIFAQGTRGSINGIVTDPNDSVVPGAAVTLKESLRGTEFSTTSDDSGSFQFLELEPAVYTLTISANGFAAYSVVDIKVEPNRNLRIDSKLTVGSSAVEVSVTAGQELVDRETPTLGSTVDPKRIVGLPINGRNVLDLAGLQTGVTTSAGALRVNGGRTVENNFTLDGANNNEIAVGGAIGAQPRPDEVQEFRILTSVPEAEFGRNSGSIINVVTKSGGNEYHGNARIFYRPTFLSAAKYLDQNDPSDQPRSGPGDYRRRYERKQGGGNIGGPLVFPWFGEGTPSPVWSGKGKSFFFAGYERTGQLIGDSRTVSNLPSIDERNGIFSRPAASPLIDPATGLAFPTISTSGTTIRQQIPSARFTPIANYYLQFLPIPNAAGQASVGADAITNNDIFTLRLDPYVTEKQIFSGTFNYFNTAAQTPFVNNGGASVPGFGGVNKQKTYAYSARHTYLFSANLVNSFLASYSRNNFPSLAPVNTTTPAQIGFTANFVASSQFAGPPQLRLFDRNLLLGNSIQGPQARITENFQIQDSLSWSTGAHRFKFGFDGTKYRQNTDFLFINQGFITFTRTVGGNTSGDDFADLLLGIPSVVQFGSNGERDYRQEGGALFAQDNWKVSNSLTLSMGVRYEYVGPLSDKYNRVAYYRPTAAAQGITSTLLTTGQLKTFEGVTIPVPAGTRAPVGLLYVGDPDPDLGGTVPAGGVAKDLNNFGPRFGFAYSPKVTGFLSNLFGKNQESVVRGGFGVFYGAIIGDTALQQLSAPGYQGTNAFYGSLGGTLADPFAPDPYPNYNGVQPQIVNPFLTASAPTIGVAQVTRSTGNPARLTQLSRAIDPNIKTPYTYQYNLTFERSFLNDYVLRVGYVGSRGRKLYAIEQVNAAYGTLIPYPTNIPAAQQFAPTVVATNVNGRRANTDYGLGIAQQVAAGNSWYNSGQIDLSRRFSDGLLFQVAYTFSKSITDTGGTDTNRGQLDLIDRKFGKGLSSDDVPHRLAVSYIYEIPFAKNIKNGFLRRALDGWETGGIYIYESGKVFSVGNANDSVGTGGGIITFADLNQPFTRLDPKKNSERAFNANAFRNVNCAIAPSTSLVGCARRGTSGVNQFRLDNPINEFNISLIKKIGLWNESTNLELRFEGFNVFNTTQFTAINLTLPATVDPPTDASGFGKYTDTREARVLQLGARFSF